MIDISEAVNAGTMIIGAALSVTTFWMLPKSMPTILVLVSCFVHNPFSVAYHLKCATAGHDWDSWKWDVCMIFVASVPLCLAISLRALPLPTALMWTAYTACVAATYVEHYIRLSHEELDRLDYVAHSMRVLHIIHCYTVPMFIAGSSCVFGVLVPLLIGGTAYAFKFPVDYSNHIMHVCIIIAHLFAYRFVTRTYSVIR